MELKKYFDPKDWPQAEALLFPVKKVELPEVLNDPGITTMSGISNAVIVNDKHIVNFCSEDYYLRTNRSILQDMGEILHGEKLPFSFKAHRFKSNRFKMEFILKDLTMDLGSSRVGDPVSISLSILNSYDGTVGFSIEISITRLVCSNGMVTPKPVMTLKKTHTGQMLKFIEISPDEIRSGIQLAKELFDESVQYYYDLMDFKVRNLDTLVDSVIEETKFPASLKEVVQQRIATEQEMGYELSHWLVYNGFNYALNHGNESLVGRKANSIDNAILDFLLI